MNLVSDLSQADLEIFHQFVAEQFGQNYILNNSQFLNWQYLNNPQNLSSHYSIKIIKHHQQILGYCGFIPVDFRVGSTTARLAMLANLVVAPATRGVGLGIHLLKAIMDEFPLVAVNGYSQMLKKNLQQMRGWQEMGNLNRLILALNPSAAAVLAATNSEFPPISIHHSSSIQLKQIDKFDDSVLELDQRLSHQIPQTTKRTPAYLNWRFLEVPFLKYQVFGHFQSQKLLGYAVWRVEIVSAENQKIKVGRLVDFYHDLQNEEVFVVALIKKWQADGLDLVDYFTSLKSQCQTLTKLGFGSAETMPYSEVPILLQPIDRSRKHINWAVYRRPDFSIANFSDSPDDWYINKSDGDQDRANLIS